MSMTTGGASGGQSANINVTPLIDVLLVLLIIFMVITPLTPKGLDALVPQPPPPNAPKNPPTDRTIVVQLMDHGPNNIPFANVATVIDLAHAAGVDKVGLITAKIEAGN